LQPIGPYEGEFAANSVPEWQLRTRSSARSTANTAVDVRPSVTGERVAKSFELPAFGWVS
jgi:hypothetical protein